jgi:hypothetical protein
MECFVHACDKFVPTHYLGVVTLVMIYQEHHLPVWRRWGSHGATTRPLMYILVEHGVFYAA